MFSNDPDRKIDLLGWLLHGVGLAVAILLVAAAYIAIVLPIDRELAELSEREAQLQQLLNRSDQIRADRKNLKMELASARGRIQKMERSIPREPSEADFLAQIAEAAGQVGLQIEDYRPGDSTQERNYSRMEVLLSGNGSYGSICDFLERVQRFPRLSRIIHFEVSALDNVDRYPFKLTLAVFFDVRRPSATQSAEGKHV